jgi:hypothetical protein
MHGHDSYGMIEMMTNHSKQILHNKIISKGKKCIGEAKNIKTCLFNDGGASAAWHS